MINIIITTLQRFHLDIYAFILFLSFQNVLKFYRSQHSIEYFAFLLVID